MSAFTNYFQKLTFRWRAIITNQGHDTRSLKQSASPTQGSL